MRSESSVSTSLEASEHHPSITSAKVSLYYQSSLSVIIILHVYMQALRRELEQNDIDPDSIGLIHSIMRNKYKKQRKRPKLLLALLTCSEADINLRTNDGSTALHKAVEVSTMICN